MSFSRITETLNDNYSFVVKNELKLREKDRPFGTGLNKNTTEEITNNLKGY